MIFNSIRLQNFRQYKKPMEFIFSVPNQNRKSITLIVAANGVGKTTLLQAFRYCFYGSSSNYLNLPKSDELVNNTLVKDLKDLDEKAMYVEVSFEHDDINYVARREQNYIKNKGDLKHHGNEMFSLSYMTKDSGWKTFKESEATDKIKSILPDGLSQVFMFDGERMERNISDSKFSNELKESILGILGIKKYAKLIDVIGHQGKASSVIGLLTSRKKADSVEDQKTKRQYEDLLQKRGNIEDEIEEIILKIEAIDNQISINKDQQKKLSDNRARVIDRDQFESFIKDSEDKIEELAKNFIRESKQALIHKHVLQFRDKYNDFISQGKTDNQFFEFLHVDTIDDIVRKGMCVCGRSVEAHSHEVDVLNNLKKHALPIEAAQYLNLINQKIRKSAEYKEIMEQLTRIKDQIRKEKIRKENHLEKVLALTTKIRDVEKELGLTNQRDLDELMDSRDHLILDKGSRINELDIINKMVLKLESKIDRIDQSIDYNKKINRVISEMITIKEKLQSIKEEKDKKAREVLSKHFNRILSQTLQGSYQVEIDSRYRVMIIDLDTRQDVTMTLSTGQNVVVSLSFISALIHTARNLSSTIDQSESYGVIMDAAMSNLDEKHIDRLSRNSLISMDQLIFLSFKRQLRNEMYQSIKEHIGQAYVITKTNQGIVNQEEMSLKQLDVYIHETEADE